MQNGKLKPHDPRELRLAEHGYQKWLVDIDKHCELTNELCEFSDLMRPSFWSKNLDRLKVNDILRVVKKGEFDCEISVAWIGPGGCGMRVVGAVVGSRFYGQLKAAEAAAQVEERAALHASIARSTP